MRIWGLFFFFLIWGSGVISAQERTEQPTPVDSTEVDSPVEKAGTAPTSVDNRQTIELEAGEVEGQLARPQVVFLLQHNEHTFRTFNIRKDVHEELHRYIPKRDMIKRYRIFYEERLKERLW